MISIYVVYFIGAMGFLECHQVLYQLTSVNLLLSLLHLGN